MSNLKRVKDKVKTLLTDFPKLRNDYKKLILTYWVIYDKVSKEFTVSHLYHSTHKITAPESITRASRWAQEKYPNLRGTNYEKRHEKQKDYKTEFKY